MRCYLKYILVVVAVAVDERILFWSFIIVARWSKLLVPEKKRSLIIEKYLVGIEKLKLD